MRALFYASNGHGLGHLMRTLAIARAMRRIEPSTEFMFLTNSEAPHLLAKDGFPVVKMLSPPASAEPLRITAARKINRGIAKAAIEGFDPDIMAVDFFPLGQLDSLDWIQRHRSRKAFIAREPNPSDAKDSRISASIQALYNLVILPHGADEGVAVPSVSLPIHHVGPIVVFSRAEAMVRATARKALGLPPSGIVGYVGFGGGGRRDFEQARTWVLRQAPTLPTWTFAFARPPLYRGQPLNFNVANAIEFSYAPLAECWPAFDFAISSLGFNSAAELLHHGIATIFVDMPAASDDWTRRGRMIVAAGAGITVRSGDTLALSDALRSLTEARRREISEAAMTLMPENGAENAARLLLKLGEAADA